MNEPNKTFGKINTSFGLDSFKILYQSYTPTNKKNIYILPEKSEYKFGINYGDVIELCYHPMAQCIAIASKKYGYGENTLVTLGQDIKLSLGIIIKDIGGSITILPPHD